MAKLNQPLQLQYKLFGKLGVSATDAKGPIVRQGRIGASSANANEYLACPDMTGKAHNKMSLYQPLPTLAFSELFVVTA